MASSDTIDEEEYVLEIIGDRDVLQILQDEENEVVIVETETQRKWRYRNKIIAADTDEVIHDLVKALPVGSGRTNLSFTVNR